LNLCVIASGKGSNLKAIIKATEKKIIDSKVVVVISNNSGSEALQTARQNKIPAIHLSAKLFAAQAEFDSALLNLLKKYKIDLIVLAGYLKKLSPIIVKRYKNKIINIHPALLPDFGGEGMFGLKVHQAVIDSGNKISGVTVHFVDEEYDKGKIILQKKINIKKNEDAVSLEKRLRRIEHKIYPEAIRLIEDGIKGSS